MTASKFFRLFALTFTTSVLLQSIAKAEYDGADCQTNGMIRSAQLECVSCGVQSFYKKRNPNSDEYTAPSDKWLALLGMMTVQTANLSSNYKSFKDNNINAKLDARETYVKRMIAQIQAYGFCTSYNAGPGKKKNKRTQTAEYTDLTSDEWARKVNPYLTGNVELDEKGLKEEAEFFGFHNPYFGSEADKNMRYLTTGHRVTDDSETPEFSSMSMSQRRDNFRKRVKEALASEYDRSGERDRFAKTVIGKENKSNGLRDCLMQIQDGLDGKPSSPAAAFLADESASVEICQTMANACDMKPDFCGSVATAATTKPGPITPGSKAPPAPPIPGKAAPAAPKIGSDGPGRSISAPPRTDLPNPADSGGSR